MSDVRRGGAPDPRTPKYVRFPLKVFPPITKVKIGPFLHIQQQVVWYGYYRDDIRGVYYPDGIAPAKGLRTTVRIFRWTVIKKETPYGIPNRDVIILPDY
jgi:hypothetical protein